MESAACVAAADCNARSLRRLKPAPLISPPNVRFSHGSGYASPLMFSPFKIVASQELPFRWNQPIRSGKAGTTSALSDGITEPPSRPRKLSAAGSLDDGSVYGALRHTSLEH